MLLPRMKATRSSSLAGRTSRSDAARRAGPHVGKPMWQLIPFLVGWLCKVVSLRYGGIRAYRAALPFFIGLILGDYVIASIWTLIGVATGVTMYRCFPN